MTLAAMLGIRTVAPTDDVNAARREILDSEKDERAIRREIMARPEAERTFELWLQRAAQDGPSVNVEQAASPDTPGSFQRILRWGKRDILPDPERALAALVAALAPDVLRGAAADDFDALYAARGPGLMDEERRARLAKCAARRLAGELAEERAHRAAEARGDVIDRRPDAACNIVLAPDAELAGPARPTTIDGDRLHALTDAATLVRAMAETAIERELYASKALQHATEMRDRDRQSTTPVTPAERAARLDEHAAAVQHHTAEHDRHAATAEAVRRRLDAIRQLALRCQKHAREHGVDRRRDLEPGADMSGSSWASPA